jgi:hypothetical protein
LYLEILVYEQFEFNKFVTKQLDIYISIAQATGGRNRTQCPN